MELFIFELERGMIITGWFRMVRSHDFLLVGEDLAERLGWNVDRRARAKFVERREQAFCPDKPELPDDRLYRFVPTAAGDIAPRNGLAGWIQAGCGDSCN